MNFQNLLNIEFILSRPSDWLANVLTCHLGILRLIIHNDTELSSVLKRSCSLFAYIHQSINTKSKTLNEMREMILAHGWPFIRSARLAVILLSSCLPSSNTTLHHWTSSRLAIKARHQGSSSRLEASEHQSNTCVRLIKRVPENHNKITLVDRKDINNRILPVDFFIKLYSTERWELFA